MQAIDNKNLYEPLVLTPWQRQVLEALEGTETEKYPLSKWYLGALYALDNPNNPDRISQAAQSLRELLEKLPRLIQGSDVQGDRSGFKEMRNNIEKHIIDNDLGKALRTVQRYLELNKQPTRRERIQRAVEDIDPMVNQLGNEIRETKRDSLLSLWQRLESFAHHNSEPDEEEFRKCLAELERVVFDLFAPITAQDQKKIQKILSCSNRSENDVEQMFSLIQRRGANFVFFFKHAAQTADATWLPFLNERRYFTDPPNVESIGGNRVIFPFWWPIHYLAKIANQVPDEIIEIVRRLPTVDNPSVYSEILEIALQLDGEQSAKLKPKILEYADLDFQLGTHRYADLLAHWTAENQTAAALELTEVLVEFAPDPQSKAKEKRRKKNPTYFATFTAFCMTSLEPSPRIGSSEYREIMSKGVRPLAEKEPGQVALILISTTANMIRLRKHQEELNQKIDPPEIWYERLRESDSNYDRPEKMLVHALTSACEQVYEKSPDLVMVLDTVLRKQQWGVFKHLRQHLYAQYPNEQTKPWIRELILGHEGYDQWEHRYEFQRMIRNACKHFGASLLTKAEQAQIFDAIRRGPSKDNYQTWVAEWLGEEFTEERCQQRQRDFHRKQFKPFESVLFGEYATYFRELEAKATAPISDEDYPPRPTKSGHVSTRSPRSSEDLAAFTDEELLSYLNEWEGKEFLSKDNLLVEINIEGLAKAFQTVFKEKIIPDANRLKFWLENRERITRPIYVRMMINGMQADVQEKNFDRLNEWLRFSEWVLSHPDQEYEGDHSLGMQGDESRTRTNWYNSRRAVGNFIEVCLEKDVNIPVFARKQLAQLLKMLCTQFDSWLDRGKRVLVNRNDPLSEGFNNTRSLALQTLIEFGFWLRGHNSESEISEVKMILEKRFALQPQYPLTLPEYAILGRNYPRIFDLIETWAVEHKSDFFPQNKLSEWLTAFSSFVCYSDPFKPTFEILRNDFDFALQHIADFKKQNTPGKEQIDSLGQHLFHYYLWKMYPLKESVGNNEQCSLLERYYQATNNNREHWANLFDYVGRILRNTGNQLGKTLKERTIAFFDWRFEEKEPRELQQFTFWLKAKCLNAEWRLDTYSKILDVCKSNDGAIAMQVETLCELLPDHTAKVLECFVKLTDGSRDNNIYIRTEEAKTILKAGLETSDESVRQNAERARENLLREGRFDLLELDD